MLKWTLPLILVAVSACAKKPDRIAAAEISGDPYRGYSCSQMRSEKLKISQELETASALQKQAANEDAFGVFLIGLPVSSMSGKDKEATIAIAKGRLQLLDRKLLQKGCK